MRGSLRRGREGEEALTDTVIAVALVTTDTLAGVAAPRGAGAASVLVTSAATVTRARRCNASNVAQHPTQSLIGAARFIDASIYRDTFPVICTAILFFIITIFFFFYVQYNDFHLGRKDT